ncbi:glycosyltransferase family 2 protein [Martelella alba]|uniref:Glycosyltransferase family 2 protein n=1 Tax=Martelella alba TaxID=2590451 RepID=A0A506U5H5_9HYPH|nr:glycosyltransferase family A protein [Martelella alba]TPW29110.1 glycosyltransferase family 2 protein [Martelella alba]
MSTVSIIMPCLNAARHIAATLETVLAQTFRDFEILIVDGGSVDESREIIAGYSARDPRVKPFFEVQKSASHARNFAVSSAAGRYLAFIDAGDRWAPDKLAMSLKRMIETDETAAVYGRVGCFRLDPVTLLIVTRIREHDLNMLDLLGENPVLTISNFVVKRSWYEEAGGFDTGMLYGNFLDWLLRLQAKGARIRGIDQFLTHMHIPRCNEPGELESLRKGWEMAAEKARARGWSPPRQRADKLLATHLSRLSCRAFRCGGGYGTAMKLALEAFTLTPTMLFYWPGLCLRRTGAAMLNRKALIAGTEAAALATRSERQGQPQQGTHAP